MRAITRSRKDGARQGCMTKAQASGDRVVAIKSWDIMLEAGVDLHGPK